MTRWKADLLLLLVAILWGSAFVVMRLAAGHKVIFYLNGSRFLLGGLLLFPFASPKPTPGTPGFVYIFLAGLALFAAVAFQQAGLVTTTASNAGFITILYVVIVPIILWVGWKKRPSLRLGLAVFLAIAGGFFLTTGGAYRPAVGDLLILIGSFFWAMHVVVVGLSQGKITALTFASGQYLVCGLLSLGAGVLLERPTVQVWWQILPAIVYTAVFSIAAGFTLQVIAQKHTPAEDAALILSTEAVFTAFFGYLFLHERLLLLQIVGCLLIMGAVVLVQFRNHR
ncbi:MAG: DMT family transporter [Anaerolineales bacterium]|nr:DMT family transporter [Anaerolineales bacterium]MCX7609840.1 DMT family transporter [Anaerolineales bacterium]MDW8226495.1 DMT family transporter [Anaerolineales bacterium]